MNASTDLDPELRGVLHDLIEIERAPLRDALSGMVSLWLIENDRVEIDRAEAVENPTETFNKALQEGRITKANLPVAVVLALYALDYQWPENGIE